MCIDMPDLFLLFDSCRKQRNQPVNPYSHFGPGCGLKLIASMQSLLKHSSTCTRGRCPQCYWERNGPSIIKEFMIADKMPVTWLEESTDPFAIGCLVCRAEYPDSTDSWMTLGVNSYSMVQRNKIQKHCESAMHRKAVTRCLQLADDCMQPPSTAEFKAVLDHCRRNPIGAAGVKSVGGHKKCRRILYTLAEGSRIRKRLMWKNTRAKHQQLCFRTDEKGG